MFYSVFLLSTSIYQLSLYAQSVYNLGFAADRVNPEIRVEMNTRI